MYKGALLYEAASQAHHTTAAIWFRFAPPKFLLHCVPQKLHIAANVVQNFRALLLKTKKQGGKKEGERMNTENSNMISRFVFPIVLLLSTLDCINSGKTPNDNNGNNGNEFNGISGIVTHSDDTPTKDVIVYLLSKPNPITRDNIQDDSCSYLQRKLFTDGDGKFLFDSIPEGEYWIEITSDDSAYAWIACGIYSENASINLGQIMLMKSACISGRIDCFNLENKDDFNIFITSPFNRIVRSDTSGTFSFCDLVSGTYVIRILPYLVTQFRDYAGWDTTVDISAAGQLDIGTIFMPNRSDVQFNEEYRLEIAAVQAILDSNGSTVTPEAITCPIRNHIVYLFDGFNAIDKITPDISVLTSLEWLTLQSHEMDTLPVEITELPKLRHLALYSGPLKVIPERVSEMKSMESFRIFGNEVENIPDALMQLPRLYSVSFDYNKICNPSSNVLYFLDNYDYSSKPWRTTQKCTN
jgi:hypothetical protein